MSDVLNLLSLIRAHATAYAVAIVTLAVGTICFLFVPPQIGNLIGVISELKDGSFNNQIWSIVFMLAGLLTIQAVCSAIHAYVVSNTSEKITNRLRLAFYSNLISEPMHSADTNSSGQIASEFASDLVVIQGGLAENLINLLRNALFSLAAFVALMFISPQITLVTLAGVAVIVVIVAVFIKAANKSILEVQKHRAKAVSLLLESGNSRYIIQAYNRINFMNDRFNNTVQESFKKVRKHLFLMACVSPVTLIVFSIVMSLSLAYGANQVSLSKITLEEFVTYISYAVIMVSSVSQVGLLFGRLKQAAVLYLKHESKFTILNESEVNSGTGYVQPEEENTENKKSFELSSQWVKPGSLGLKVSDVYFSYFNASSPAVRGVTLQAKPGKITAILGKSGAGKSTMAGLLSGLFRPTHGQVEYISDDPAILNLTNAFKFSRNDEYIAIVPQEPFLMSGTYMDNITFGDKNISLKDVQQAARQARIADFIESLPDCYDSVIGEHGDNLSRGQKQRISLARALVRKPKILLLDEATASLDVVSERAIKNLLDELRGEVTVIVIAHQGQLLSVVDHIFIMDEGKVIFDGTSEDFAQTNHDDSFSNIFQQTAMNG